MAFTLVDRDSTGHRIDAVHAGVVVVGLSAQREHGRRRGGETERALREREQPVADLPREVDRSELGVTGRVVPAGLADRQRNPQPRSVGRERQLVGAAAELEDALGQAAGEVDRHDTATRGVGDPGPAARGVDHRPLRPERQLVRCVDEAGSTDRLRLALVPDSVRVGVDLARVPERRAVVAGVAVAVRVRVLLAGVGDEGAVVAVIEQAVAVGVLAGVAHAVAVAVLLAGVGGRRAVVAQVAAGVAVGVGLVRVRKGRAVVARVRQPVAVRILAGVAGAVAVLVPLLRIEDEGAAVGRVRDAIAVAVGHGRVGAALELGRVRQAVAVRVGRRVEERDHGLHAAHDDVVDEPARARVVQLPREPESKLDLLPRVGGKVQLDPVVVGTGGRRSADPSPARPSVGGDRDVSQPVEGVDPAGEFETGLAGGQAVARGDEPRLLPVPRRLHEPRAPGGAPRRGPARPANRLAEPPRHDAAWIDREAARRLEILAHDAGEADPDHFSVDPRQIHPLRDGVAHVEHDQAADELDQRALGAAARDEQALARRLGEDGRTAERQRDADIGLVGEQVPRVIHQPHRDRRRTAGKHRRCSLGLGRERDPEAVARVADPVAVGVLLAGIRGVRAVVTGVRNAVAVGILAGVARPAGMHRVGLVGVVGGRAAIARIAAAVAIAVGLRRIRQIGAVVPRVHHAVLVAVLARVAGPVAVAVLLGVVVFGRAVVRTIPCRVLIGIDVEEIGASLEFFPVRQAIVVRIGIRVEKINGARNPLDRELIDVPAGVRGVAPDEQPAEADVLPGEPRDIDHATIPAEPGGVAVGLIERLPRLASVRRDRELAPVAASAVEPAAVGQLQRSLRREIEAR